jgi:hypothetical protein
MRATWQQATTLIAVLLCLGPPAAVAAIGLGVPPAGAVAVPLVAAVAVGFLWRGLPGLPVHLVRQRPLLALVWLAALGAAGVQTLRASAYALDATRPWYSTMPGDRFRVEHCCLTAYGEAARMAVEGGDVYDRELYWPGGVRRRIGPLTVDPYHYPPPFLLMPAALRAVAPDFFDLRRVWFGVQAIVLGGTVLLTAWWIGGADGRRVALLGAAVWAAPPIFMTLQTGNFQTSAIALSLAGCLLLQRRYLTAGSALLAFPALGKIFPSLLVLHVLAWRRWRVTAALAAAALCYTLAAAAWFGLDPYIQFVRDELPKLASGAAFPQTEQPGTAQVNQSVYGLTTKLRVLGASGLDQPTGKLLTRCYALLLAIFVVRTGWRMTPGLPGASRDRLRLAILWLASLNLASFTSPFVGVAYGAAGTIWLGTLMFAAAGSRGAQVGVVLMLLVAIGAVIASPSPRPLGPPDLQMVLLALIGQTAGLALNLWGARLGSAGLSR